MDKVFSIQLQNNKKIVANIAEFQEIFKILYLPTLPFSTTSFRQSIARHTSWLLRCTIVGQEHRSLGALLRKKMKAGSVAEVDICWIDEEIGYGVFAREDIPIQAFVGEYTGDLRQIKRFHADLNGYCMHYPTRFFSYNYFVIDAEKAGNEMRFVNHSDDPNLKPMCVIDQGLQHIVLFASKPIAKGEQLTFNYGKDYWRKRTKRWLPY